jgi:hypothetical protein
MKESDVKFFRPLWRRLLVAAICVTWFAFEAFFGHDQLWIVLSGAAVAYCAWNFFLKFPKDQPATPAASAPADDPASPTQP